MVPVLVTPHANPYRRQTQSHRWWNTGVRRAELALDELMRIGA